MEILPYLSKSIQSAIGNLQCRPTYLEHAFEAAFRIWIFCKLIDSSKALGGEGMALFRSDDTTTNGFNVSLGLFEHLFVRADIQTQADSMTGMQAVCSPRSAFLSEVEPLLQQHKGALRVFNNNIELK